MAGPSRFGSILIVSVLSLLVLGAVWGLVIYLLPQSEGVQGAPRIVIAPSFHPSPDPVPQAESSDRHQPDRVAPPVVVRESPRAQQPRSLDHAIAEPGRVPLGLDLKCDGEVEALCPEAEGLDRRACLQEKIRQISGPCQQVLRDRLVRMKEAMQHLRTACEADAKRYCRDVPIGGGAMVQCLQEHSQEVSDQCFESLPKRGRLVN